MMTIELTSDALAAAGRALSGRGAVQMVNLLRYRARADYGTRTDLAPCSGREAYYERYVPAFNKVADGREFRLVWLGRVQATLLAAGGEAWDDIAIVEYPSFEVLRSIVESPEYATEADPHRRAALADWCFLATSQIELPG